MDDSTKPVTDAPTPDVKPDAPVPEPQTPGEALANRFAGKRA